MRLHTPVSIVNRMLDQPVVTDGVEIPAGILIDLGIYHAQNHPDVWQNPTVGLIHAIYRTYFF